MLDEKEQEEHTEPEVKFTDGFYEDFVYDLNTNLIKIYLNISNQEKAENGHSKQATFLQNLEDFNVTIEQ